MAQRYFADSFYFIAMFSRRDAAHERVIRFSQQAAGEMVTTDAVLLEFADALSSPSDRGRVAVQLEVLWDDPKVTVRTVDRALLRRAARFYASRKDKDWGLTDCISFVVMQDEGLTEALTGDTHFEQAGFRILFPQD